MSLFYEDVKMMLVQTMYHISNWIAANIHFKIGLYTYTRSYYHVSCVRTVLFEEVMLFGTVGPYLFTNKVAGDGEIIQNSICARVKTIVRPLTSWFQVSRRGACLLAHFLNNVLVC
jgi:hypothetical protein